MKTYNWMLKESPYKTFKTWVSVKYILLSIILLSILILQAKFLTESLIGAIIVLLLFIVIFWLIRLPITFLYFFIPTWPFFSGLVQDIIVFNLFGVPFTPSRIVGLVLIFGIGIYLIVSLLVQRHKIFFHPILNIYLLFILWSFIAVWLAPHRVRAVSDFIRLLGGFSLLLLVANLFTKKEAIIKLSKLIVLSSSILASIIIIQYVLLIFFSINIILPFYYEESLGVPRIGGITGSGPASGFLLLGVGLSLFLYDSETKLKKQIFYRFSEIFMIVAIVLSTSRTGILSILIFFTVRIFSKYLRNKSFFKALKEVVFLFIILACGFLTVKPEFWQKRLSDVPFIGEMALTDEQWGMGRGEIWSWQIYAFKHSPSLVKIVGNGLASYARLPTADFVSHNDYIQLLRDVGIIGLLIYFAFIIATIKLSTNLMLIKNKVSNAFGIAILCVFLSICFSHSMFGNTVFTSSYRWSFMAIIGLALGMWRGTVGTKTEKNIQ